VHPSSVAPGAYALECLPGADPRGAIFRLAVERGWTLLGLAAERASLEDVFVRLTTRDGSVPDPSANEEAA
jgi:hypothetical protein